LSQQGARRIYSPKRSISPWSVFSAQLGLIGDQGVSPLFAYFFEFSCCLREKRLYFGLGDLITVTREPRNSPGDRPQLPGLTRFGHNRVLPTRDAFRGPKVEFHDPDKPPAKRAKRY
jgi:hypothetical protein